MIRNLLMGTFGIAFGTVVVTQVLMPTIKNASTTGWSAGEIALWGLSGLGIVGGFVWSILTVFGIV